MTTSRLHRAYAARTVRMTLPLICFAAGMMIVGGSFGALRGTPRAMADATPGPAVVQGDTQQIITGRVELVGESMLRLTVNGEKTEILVDDATSITKGGETIPLSTVAMGDAVSCTVTGPSGKLKATEIKVVAK